MKKYRMKHQLVKESPDEIHGMDKKYHYMKKLTDYESYMTHAFGYHDNIMYVSKEKGTHPEILSKLDKSEGFQADARVKFKYPGRVWLGHKYISFWLYPKTNNELKNVVNDLEVALSKKLNRSIKIWEDSEYRIDVNIISDDINQFGQNPEGQWGKYNEQSIDLIPLKDFVGSNDASEEDMKKAHTLSPMEKNQKNLSYAELLNKGYRKFSSGPNNESFYPRLNENPNTIADPKEWEAHKNQKSYTPKPIEYNYGGAIPFAYYGPDEIFMAGSPKTTHPAMLKKAYKKGLIPSRKYLIERTVNSGRVFPIVKVISFWNYPANYNELVKVIKDIEQNTKMLNILNDPEWRIEIPAGEFRTHIDKENRPNKMSSWGSTHSRISHMNFVKIEDYRGGHQRSAEELKQNHVESPMSQYTSSWEEFYNKGYRKRSGDPLSESIDDYL